MQPAVFGSGVNCPYCWRLMSNVLLKLYSTVHRYRPFVFVLFPLLSDASVLFLSLRLYLCNDIHIQLSKYWYVWSKMEGYCNQRPTPKNIQPLATWLWRNEQGHVNKACVAQPLYVHAFKNFQKLSGIAQHSNDTVFSIIAQKTYDWFSVAKYLDSKFGKTFNSNKISYTPWLHT